MENPHAGIQQERVKRGHGGWVTMTQLGRPWLDSAVGIPDRSFRYLGLIASL